MLVEDPAGSIPSLKDCVSEDSEKVLRLLAALGNGTKFPVILHDPVERGLNTSLQKYIVIEIKLIKLKSFAITYRYKDLLMMKNMVTIFIGQRINLIYC